MNDGVCFALGVLDALGSRVDASELRFRFYLLYATAQRLTWLDYKGERKLTEDERELCNLVEDLYRELDTDAH